MIKPCNTIPIPAQRLTPHNCRELEHLHALGPRAFGEFLIELIGQDHSLRMDVDVLLERYARLDIEITRALGGDKFPPVPIHEVAA